MKHMNDILKISILMVLTLVITSCSLSPVKEKEPYDNSRDALAFKDNYEAINRIDAGEGQIFREVNIDENNPIVEISAEDLIKKIESKESFFVLFADERDAKTRAVIETTLVAAKESKLDYLYYVDMLDQDGQEKIRDVYTLNEDNNPVILEPASTEYSRLLEIMDNVLGEYTIRKDEEEIAIGEKRINLPLVVRFKDGVSYLSNGIVPPSLKDDIYRDLTNEEIKGIYATMSGFFSD